MTLVEFLTGIADAIRTRKETTARINAQNFAAEILTLGPKFESIDITENGEYDVEDYKMAKVLVPTGDTAVGLIQRDITEYNIPYGITKVGGSAFRDFLTLTKVTIPETVQLLEKNAFNGCSYLEEVNLPASIKSIGQGCFGGASRASFTNGLPDGLLSIGMSAFYSCNFGDELIIPVSVTNLEQYSLSGIRAKSVICLANVTSIPENCFSDAVAENVTLPNSVTKIEQRAFTSSDVASVVLPESLTEIGDEVFRQCNELTEVTMPSNVTTVGYQAFYWCRKLKKAVLNEGLTSLGSGCFSSSGLEEVNIPSTLSVLSASIFHGTNVRTFFIPSTVTKIERNALSSGATGYNVIMESATPCTMEYSFNTSYLGKIYVPKGSGDIYRSATNWSAYADYIVETSSVNVVVPNEMLNNETYLYSIDNSETWHQFSETSFTIENAGIITFKNASADTTLLIGTTAGGNDVATISNAVTEYLTDGDATLYFTIT